MDKTKLQTLLSNMVALTATAGIEVRNSPLLWEKFEDIARAIAEAQLIVDAIRE